ncbi:LysR family transcriptional regulator [Sphingobium boeckii]|uniref:DNA-binding transcriptional LysR family regulator n=1 Tax=Sphingobium boeckii TaxID=1082345 RepID=A0A7W9EDW7_9SPHN|nr:LysR family transcriptional regulator [Sphingobium boeckii]MBB5685354.1 DNA-binding transcriptional LysR family regulator [Sphingobium boeckii]
MRSLRYLLALSERLHFARAAEDLGISQSALSRSLQALEKQLGMRLFDRDRAGVSVTPQGRRVIERASHLIAEVSDLERHFVLSAKGEAGHICFGMGPMPSRALLSGVLSERLKTAPEVTNEVVVRDVEALWSLLLANEIEFFVSQDGLLPDASQARVELLGNFPLSLIVREDHPLLRGPCEGQTFPIVRSSWAGLPLPPEIERYARGPSHVIEDYGSLAAITKSTDAIWFSSRYAVTDELWAGSLRELPRASDTVQREIRMVVYSLARRSQSPLARALKQALRQRVTALTSFA